MLNDKKSLTSKFYVHWHWSGYWERTPLRSNQLIGLYILQPKNINYKKQSLVGDCLHANLAYSLKKTSTFMNQLIEKHMSWLYLGISMWSSVTICSQKAAFSYFLFPFVLKYFRLHKNLLP